MWRRQPGQFWDGIEPFSIPPHGFAEEYRMGTGNRPSGKSREKLAAAMIHSGRMQLDKHKSHTNHVFFASHLRTEIRTTWGKFACRSLEGLLPLPWWVSSFPILKRGSYLFEVISAVLLNDQPPNLSSNAEDRVKQRKRKETVKKSRPVKKPISHERNHYP